MRPAVLSNHTHRGVNDGKKARNANEVTAQACSSCDHSWYVSSSSGCRKEFQTHAVISRATSRDRMRRGFESGSTHQQGIDEVLCDRLGQRARVERGCRSGRRLRRPAKSAEHGNSAATRKTEVTL